MTRFDYLKNLSVEQAAEFLCDGIEKMTDKYPCDCCPREEECSLGDNGWAKWLSAEAYK